MPTARRLTREDWIAIARKVLVRSGVDDVKIDRIAKQMKVTRGSFYWHFKDRKDLLDSLLSDWEEGNRAEIAEIRERWDRSTPDLSEVVRIWLNEDPAFPSFDMAIRGWARKSRTVAAAVRRTDDAWIALLKELFVLQAVSDEEAFVRARVTYFHQIGYYALALNEKMEERIRLLPLYHKILTGDDGGTELKKVISEVSARLK